MTINSFHLRKVLFFVALCISLLSCYNSKKAANDLNKAKTYYPNVAAEKCAEWYPVKPLEIKSDSTAYKEWLKSTDSILSKLSKDTTIDTVVKYRVLRDTLQKVIYQFKTLIKTIPPIHDTIKIVDIAHQSEIEGKLKETETKLNDNYKLMNKVSLLALLLLLILFIITILKKK